MAVQVTHSGGEQGPHAAEIKESMWEHLSRYKECLQNVNFKGEIAIDSIRAEKGSSRRGEDTGV